VRAPRVRVIAVLLFGGALAACGNPFGREYEYEEQIYLRVDGSATVVLDASVPALVALRGVTLDPAPTARLTQADVRAVFEQANCPVASVGQPWRRQGRRFVQVRLSVDRIDDLASCGPFAWSSYRLSGDGTDELRYEQAVGPSAGGDPGPVNWTGREIVAFKLHAPSRVIFHNVKRLEDGADGDVDRGNILTWEQRLVDRRNGVPVRMDVLMGADSILYTTLMLFVGAFVAAVAVLLLAAWLTVRRGRRMAR